MITAEIVVLDQPIILNRLGSSVPNGIMYALKSDVVPIDISKGLVAGNAMLNPSKRPRPLVLRANMGDRIVVSLTNLQTPLKGNSALPEVGFSVNGMQYVNGVTDNGSWIGSGTDNQAKPQINAGINETKKYTLYAQEEGTFLIRDPSSSTTSMVGLFGSVTVQPPLAEWYRSQVTNEDLYYATDHWIAENGDKITKQDAIRNGLAKDNQVVETIGYPVINYQAKFPAGHKKAGNYVLKMLDDANKIIYSDLTAIITGPNNGRFLPTQTGPLFDAVPASPDRRQPYREICIHYHQPLTNATQAFSDAVSDLPTVLLEGGDSFAINYASAGIVNEIVANRIKVGPSANCVECKYEEFFLSSWSAGDPAMVADVDATTSYMDPRHPKASYVKYADDPSNVYHAYLWDHTKFRINHADRIVTHVHHFHAHQWLHSPNDPDGHYLDSQTINPGASWSQELVHNGAGNKNLTPGDNIFHCHFYPHFASGMWGLFRVHDVLEIGTRLEDTKGTTPMSGSRAYPDAEITNGTPIPALVPLPTKAMAPVPAKVEIDDGQVIVNEADKNPGYPFFIPGIAGSRPPHPPLDFATENGKALDGGLPRHIIKGGEIVWEQHNTTDWTKDVDTLITIKLPEQGTPVEIAAMKFHESLSHATVQPDGKKGEFRTNGQPRAPGAPFANPAVDIEGKAQGTIRTYKAANIQMDVVLNKKGWHFPQQRLIALWEDVASTIDGTRPPEPFFFRANSYEFIEFWHTNLVPDYYELDDFQVRTPTDVLGQHIHLVKFDVTSSDGAANGFNYEDGTFSPNEVQERIKGINNGQFLEYAFNPNSSLKYSNLRPVGGRPLAPTAPNPIWGKAPVNQNWYGAQTTIQRWYADPLYNNEGKDRTIRTVFTHDHFSPSTHQQIGLYAGLLVEPRGSKWHDPETNEEFGTRPDGGPTSFQAIIKTYEKDSSYREFALEFQDLAMAYTADSRDAMTPYPEYHHPSRDSLQHAKHQHFIDSLAGYTGWRDPAHAIAPPAGPMTIAIQGGLPELFSNYSLNYRNEPLTLRVAEGRPYSMGNYNQTAGLGGDQAFVYSSVPKIANARGDQAFASQPVPGSKISIYNNFTFPKKPLTPGMEPGDPFTPLLRVYENDKVQIRTLVGAHEAPHIFNINGLPWLFEPSAVNSGYRSTQMMSISEHFEMNFVIPGNTAGDNGVTDYLYNASSDNNGLNAGIWGLIRAYPKTDQQDSLEYLPNNQRKTGAVQSSGCPGTDVAAVRQFEVGAYLVAQLTNGKPLVYNSMDTIFDPTAMIFIKEKETYGGKVVFDQKPNTAYFDPMVLRARAGECIQVNLTNHIDPSDPAFEESVEVGFKNQLMRGREINVHVTASGHVGLHPELLSYHANQSDGANIGLNNTQTAAPKGGKAKYSWYAGKWEGGKPIPVEFGSVLLTSADPVEHYARGLFGAVIVEPIDATWKADEWNQTAATVNHNGGKDSYREFVIFHQDNLLLSTVVAGRDTVSANVGFGINYRTAPFAYRYFDNNIAINGTIPDITYDATANALTYADPATPVFAAAKGTPVRIRLIKPGGAGNAETFILDGHIWQEEPYTNGSTKLGYNPNSQWLGSRPQVAALNNFDLLIESAGGKFAKPGDYRYDAFFDGPFQGGSWGLVRVTDGKDAITLTRVEKHGGTFDLYATTTVDARRGNFNKRLTLKGGKGKRSSALATNLGYAGNGTMSWKFSNLPESLLSKKSISIESGKDGDCIETNGKALNALVAADHPRAVPNDSQKLLRQTIPFSRASRAKSDER